MCANFNKKKYASFNGLFNVHKLISMSLFVHCDLAFDLTSNICAKFDGDKPKDSVNIARTGSGVT